MATAASATDPLGYYAVLGLAYDASPDDVRRAYRREAKRWHPDHNGSPDAAAHMARLNDAYEVLGDPDQRAAYDRGAFVHSEPEPPPRPVAYPAAVNFGTLRAGDRETRTVRIGNAGGLFATIRVEPECGTWFRVAAARGGSSGDVVAELDFEAFALDDAASGPRGKVVRIFLDDEVVSVVLGATVLPTAHRRSAPPADSPDPGSTSTPPSSDLRVALKRGGFALVTGVADPIALNTIGQYLDTGWYAAFLVLAVGLLGITVYSAYRTYAFTRIDTAPGAIQLLSSGVFWLGKASLVLGAVALATAIVIGILAVILVVAIIALGFGIVAAVLDS